MFFPVVSISTYVLGVLGRWVKSRTNCGVVVKRAEEDELLNSVEFDGSVGNVDTQSVD